MDEAKITTCPTRPVVPAFLNNYDVAFRMNGIKMEYKSFLSVFSPPASFSLFCPPWQWWEMQRFRKWQLRENYHFTALLSDKAFTNLCACLIVQPCRALSIFLYIIKPDIFDGKSEEMFAIIQSTGIANFGTV